MELLEELADICASPQTGEEILKLLFDRHGMSLDILQYGLSGYTVRSYLAYLKGGRAAYGVFSGEPDALEDGFITSFDNRPCGTWRVPQGPFFSIH